MGIPKMPKGRMRPKGRKLPPEDFLVRAIRAKRAAKKPKPGSKR